MFITLLPLITLSTHALTSLELSYDSWVAFNKYHVTCLRTCVLCINPHVIWQLSGTIYLPLLKSRPTPVGLFIYSVK